MFEGFWLQPYLDLDFSMSDKRIFGRLETDFWTSVNVQSRCMCHVMTLLSTQLKIVYAGLSDPIVWPLFVVWIKQQFFSGREELCWKQVWIICLGPTAVLKSPLSGSPCGKLCNWLTLWCLVMDSPRVCFPFKHYLFIYCLTYKRLQCQFITNRGQQYSVP